MPYKEIGIRKCASGFGEWETTEANGDAWDDEGDLLCEIEQNVGSIFPLDEPENLPFPAEDIRGRIHNEPPRVYAYFDGEDRETREVYYFGIIEVD